MPMDTRTRSRPPAGTPCGYCFQNWATGWDHLIPLSYRTDNRSLNLYPCCRRCNSILGNRMFQTIEEKREHVRYRLIEMGKWKLPSGEDMPNMSEVIQTKEKMAEVLQPGLPTSGFPQAQGRTRQVREVRERVPRRPSMAEILQHGVPVRRLPSPPVQPDNWPYHCGPIVSFHRDGCVLIDGHEVSSLTPCNFNIFLAGQIRHCSAYAGHRGDHLIWVANDADSGLDSKSRTGTHG